MGGGCLGEASVEMGLRAIVGVVWGLCGMRVGGGCESVLVDVGGLRWADARCAKRAEVGGALLVGSLHGMYERERCEVDVPRDSRYWSKSRMELRLKVRTVGGCQGRGRATRR